MIDKELYECLVWIVVGWLIIGCFVVGGLAIRDLLAIVLDRKHLKRKELS